MGYYTGSGVVTGKSVTINELTRLAFKDPNGNDQAYIIQQRRKTTTTVKRGVEMPPSIDTEASLNDKYLSYTWWSSMNGARSQQWLVPACKGSKTDKQYTRISDSNLCESTESLIELAIRYRYGMGNYSDWET